jgi:uncharacterized protein
MRIDASAAPPAAHWQASGEVRKRRGDADQVWLGLTVRALVPLECQRCLETVHTPLDVDRDFRFAPNEETAAKLDDEEEADVLVLSRRFDLLGLIEDELLMALPVVPRHDVCPQPLETVADAAFPSGADDVLADKPPHPFAKLAALKKGSNDGSGQL